MLYKSFEINVSKDLWIPYMDNIYVVKETTLTIEKKHLFLVLL